MSRLGLPPGSVHDLSSVTAGMRLGGVLPLLDEGRYGYCSPNEVARLHQIWSGAGSPSRGEALHRKDEALNGTCTTEASHG